MQHSLFIGDDEHAVWLSRTGDGYRLHMDSSQTPVALERRAGGACTLHFDGASHEAIVAVDGETVHVHLDGETFAIRYVDPVRRHADDAAGASDDIALAPMPGTVIAVNVQPGDRVQTGQTLVVIESMKLETAIKAWRDGHVATLHVAAGEPFERSAPLVTLAAQDTVER